MAKTKQYWFKDLEHNTVFDVVYPESYQAKPDRYTPLSQAEGKRLYREQTTASLRKRLKPKTKVYTLQTHCSSSGMSRRYRVFIVEDKEITDITWRVAIVTDRQIKDGEIVVGGCGFCGGFDIVQALGYALWPNGTKKPHGTRNGEPDTCGGYALNHCKL